MATNAATRAAGEGRAESGRSSGSVTAPIYGPTRAGTLAGIGGRTRSAAVQGRLGRSCVSRWSCPPTTRSTTSRRSIRAVRQVAARRAASSWSTTAAPTAPPTAPTSWPSSSATSTVLRRDAQGGPRARRTAPACGCAIERGAEICVQMDADLSHDPAVAAGAGRRRRARRRPRDRQPLRARWHHPQLAAPAPLAVALGQPLRGRRARPGGQRRHGRLSRLPRRRRSSGWTSTPVTPRATASRSR